MFVRRIILGGLSFGLLAACDAGSARNADSPRSAQQSRPTSAADENTQQGDGKSVTVTDTGSAPSPGADPSMSTSAGTSAPIAHAAKGSRVTGSSTRFTFAVNPFVVTVPRGGSADATLTLTPIDGFHGNVIVTLDYAPEGLTLTPASFEADGDEPTVQKVTFTAAQTTPLGRADVNLNIFSTDTQGGGTTGVGVVIRQ